MPQYLHSVTLDVSRCKGCTNCIKRCPTEAIRVRDGHAIIKEENCIDCGECIRLCPYKAKKAIYDKFEDFAHYKYKIALPAPALYGQFDELDDVDEILTAILKCGFDAVFEVSRAAEIVTEYTRRYMERPDIQKPVISSACPAIVRLIGLRFSSLADNLLPIMPPIEYAARLARKEALEAHPELCDDDICVLFISPCPAKISYIKNPIAVEKTAVTGALAISDFYFKIRSERKNVKNPLPLSRTGIIGLNWAGTGGEATSLLSGKYLAADGIENCINVLDEIENGTIRDLDFVEFNACNGGCVGGTLNVENPYIAKARLRSLRKYLPISRNRVDGQDVSDDVLSDKDFFENIEGLSIESRAEAIKRMTHVEEIYKTLPHLDCGSCGAPNCHALAEDIVAGEATVEDCLIRLRENFHKN
ncbi:MAG: 4Fe-4S binding protein [Clostridia bacterium]|nr:4Fe-4S binding protein [Clostridia bacterium]MBR2389151.1 4Fe-4S binding protein [Clostridia bacterium]